MPTRDHGHRPRRRLFKALSVSIRAVFGLAEHRVAPWRQPAQSGVRRGRQMVRLRPPSVRIAIPPSVYGRSLRMPFVSRNMRLQLRFIAFTCSPRGNL
jgi:hypothetical protein